MTGNFSVNSLPAYVLFDSGASRSFFFIKFASHPSFVLDKFPVPLEVKVADSKTFIVFDVYRKCNFTIDGKDYEVDLIPMKLGEFDVVSGMDWLSTYPANIVCNQKIIKLVSPSGHEVSIQGERRSDILFVFVAQGYKVYDTWWAIILSLCGRLRQRSVKD